jgi:MFS family permease
VQRLGPSYNRLWQAAGVSNLADGILMYGGALVAVQLTRSATLVAGAMVAMSVPWLLLSLHAGALADRYDRRTLLMGAAILRASGVLLVGGLALAGLLTLPVLYAALFLVGVGEVLFDTTSQSVLPSLVERDELSVANGRIKAVQMVGNQFAGGPIAGLLVAASIAAVFFGPAALYAAAAVILLRLPRGVRTVEPTGTSMVADIREGLHALMIRPVLLRLALLALVVNLAAHGFAAVFVLFVVGPESPMGLSGVEYGLLMALLATGSVLGSLVVGWLEERLGPSRQLQFALVFAAGCLVVPAVTANAAAVAATLLVLGFMITQINVVAISSRQRIIPDRLLGRVNAAYQLIGQGAAPLGALVAGVIADLTSLPTVFVVMVALVLVGALVVVRPLTDAALAPVAADDRTG